MNDDLTLTSERADDPTIAAGPDAAHGTTRADDRLFSHPRQLDGHGPRMGRHRLAGVDPVSWGSSP